MPRQRITASTILLPICGFILLMITSPFVLLYYLVAGSFVKHPRSKRILEQPLFGKLVRAIGVNKHLANAALYKSTVGSVAVNDSGRYYSKVGTSTTVFFTDSFYMISAFDEVVNLTLTHTQRRRRGMRENDCNKRIARLNRTALLFLFVRAVLIIPTYSAIGLSYLPNAVTSNAGAWTGSGFISFNGLIQLGFYLALKYQSLQYRKIIDPQANAERDWLRYLISDLHHIILAAEDPEATDVRADTEDEETGMEPGVARVAGAAVDPIPGERALTMPRQPVAAHGARDDIVGQGATGVGSGNVEPGTNTTATDIDEGGAPVGVEAATAEPNLQENALPTNNRHVATVTTSEILRDKDPKKGSQETVGANADDVESDKIPLKLPADADLLENKEEEKAAKLEETDGRLDSERLDSSSIEHPQIKFIRRSYSDGYLSSRSSSPVTVNTAKSPHVSLSIFNAKDNSIVEEDHFDQRTSINDLQATKCMRYLNSEYGKELEKQRIAIDTNIAGYNVKIDRLSSFIDSKDKRGVGIVNESANSRKIEHISKILRKTQNDRTNELVSLSNIERKIYQELRNNHTEDGETFFLNSDILLKALQKNFKVTEILPLKPSESDPDILAKIKEALELAKQNIIIIPIEVAPESALGPHLSIAVVISANEKTKVLYLDPFYLTEPPEYINNAIDKKNLIKFDGLPSLGFFSGHYIYGYLTYIKRQFPTEDDYDDGLREYKIEALKYLDSLDVVELSRLCFHSAAESSNRTKQMVANVAREESGRISIIEENGAEQPAGDIMTSITMR